MTHSLSRRAFLTASTLSLGTASLGHPGGAPRAPALRAEEAFQAPERPVAISSRNGLRATAKAVALMESGEDPLEAVVSGVNVVELDPDDMTVGYGGLPNEAGVVELDACVMHGPSYNAGAVAALRNIKLPSRVAKLVMERTDHVLLVGEGALAFARAHGFEEEELLTGAARERWLAWKEGLSDRDDWLTPEEARKGAEARPTGTITCLGLDTRGDLSGVTTTSGLAFKIPGRVGDSPLIGAGLYVDNQVGAAGATGRGEAVIIASGSRIVVENMRRGMPPEDAVHDVLQRIAHQTVDPRLRDGAGRPAFDVVLYALRKDGAHAAGSIWKGRKYAAAGDGENALRDCIYLFEK